MRYNLRRNKTQLACMGLVLSCICYAGYLLFDDTESDVNDVPRRWVELCQPYPACLDTSDVNTNTVAPHHDALSLRLEVGMEQDDQQWNQDVLEIVDAARQYDYRTGEEILRKHDVKGSKMRNENEKLIVDIDSPTTKVNNQQIARIASNDSIKIPAPILTTIPADSPGRGEMGKPFIVNSSGQAEVDRLYPINAFNLFVSDRISLNRSLPDIRPQGCSDLVYPTNLSDTSVVIIFHNEAWSTLWRTVHSVINRSPSYLKEIILVDDASTQDHLKAKADDYARRLNFDVKIVRVQQRSGLITAKQIGSDSANGEIVVFLDSHCEVMKGWLEPLVYRVAQNRSQVALPVIDNIDDETFELVPQAMPPWQGSFRWTLNFAWLTLGEELMASWKKNKTVPLKSPVMAGGLLAIDKAFFNTLGGYDDGLKIWGGENMDLSFKTWMCGGTLETLPCSHVGHIRRDHNKPYKNHTQGNYWSKNDKRIAEIWLDPEYNDFFYYFRPDARDTALGDISRSLEIRKQCKPFRWYLENVFDETSWPTKASIFGHVKNLHSGSCLDHLEKQEVAKQAEMQVKMLPCTAEGIHNVAQVWSFTGRGEIKHDTLCLDSSGSGQVSLRFCHFLGGNQKWSFKHETNRIVHSKGECLDLVRLNDGAGTWYLTTSTCDLRKPSQNWQLQMKPWKEWYRDYEQSRHQIVP